MFFRVKTSGSRRYLQIVENSRVGKKVHQRVLATLGRIDQLQQTGQLDSLLASGARFAEKTLLLSAVAQGQVPIISTRQLGPALIFSRLWQETGCQAVVNQLLQDRRFEFPVERAIFLTVLHRLCSPGSDRACEHWKENLALDQADTIELHHLYRAMKWLGEELATDQQVDSTQLVPRTTKDLIEEKLFFRHRDIFSKLEIVFYDTTALYFEGQGSESLGQYGHSKDHRPDEHQMVVGAVLDGEGRPLCCELWPGNTADVTTLIPIVERLRQRFDIRQICIVADRGMISQKTMDNLEAKKWPYILGVRMRMQKEVREEVLANQSPFCIVRDARQKATDPAPLRVKEVKVNGHRYIVCINPEEVESDRIKRDKIVNSLREQLRKGDKSLVGNKGYKKYLKVEGESHFAVDENVLEKDAKYDGTWVLRTNTELSAEEVALQYKKLWMVEQWFRNCKSLLETRPIYHQCDATIRGHVFCSFLAMRMKHELQSRLAAKELSLEWAKIMEDLERVQYVKVENLGKQYRLRTELSGCAGQVFQAAGVAAPPTVQMI